MLSIKLKRGGVFGKFIIFCCFGSLLIRTGQYLTETTNYVKENILFFWMKGTYFFPLLKNTSKIYQVHVKGTFAFWEFSSQLDKIVEHFLSLVYGETCKRWNRNGSLRIRNLDRSNVSFDQTIFNLPTTTKLIYYLKKYKKDTVYQHDLYEYATA